MRPHSPLIIAPFLVIMGGLEGCAPSRTEQTTMTTTEDLIRQNADTAVGDSIVPVATSLVKQTVFVATESSSSTEPTTVSLDRLRFRCGQDNQGRMWAYAYTTQAELLRAFPEGSPYAELAFKDFFQIIERDGSFAGIFLNSGSDASYPIPSELFERLNELPQ